MRVRFSKMHGLGNDFVVFDAVRQDIAATPDLCRFIADRRYGIGCDQVLLVERPRLPETLFHYRIFNADGSEVAQCGNGARCLARFVREQGLAETDQIPVGTDAGRLVLHVEPDGRVRVNMGCPEFKPERVPFIAEGNAELDRYTLDVAGRAVGVGVVSMGNPHAVMVVDEVGGAPVEMYGPGLQAHPRFPAGVNVGFMEVIAADRIGLRVFERGAGETLACGSGACAAVVVGRRWGLLADVVQVRLPGGELTIEWQGALQPVWMIGPAVTVYEGEIDL